MTPSKVSKKVGKKGKAGGKESVTSEGSPEAGDAPHDNTAATETIMKPRKAVSHTASYQSGSDTHGQLYLCSIEKEKIMLKLIKLTFCLTHVV